MRFKIIFYTLPENRNIKDLLDMLLVHNRLHHLLHKKIQYLANNNMLYMMRIHNIFDYLLRNMFLLLDHNNNVHCVHMLFGHNNFDQVQYKMLYCLILRNIFGPMYIYLLDNSYEWLNLYNNNLLNWLN